MRAEELEKVLDLLEEYGVDTEIIGCKSFDELLNKINN